MSQRTADILNFISKLSIRKIINALRILLSYYAARFTAKPVVWGLPFHISIEPTTSCNLRCPECPSGLRSFTRSTGMLDISLFRKAIDQTHQHLIYLYLYFQGEPYLNPQFFDMVAYANSKNIYTVTSTNAHFLNDTNARKTIESGLDRLIISIDGTTQEVYEQYRVGGNLQKVLQGTRNLISWRKKLRSKKPYILFQFLIFKHNEHQLSEIARLTKEMGVDEIQFKTAQIYDFQHGHQLIPENDKYARYRKTSHGTYVIKNQLNNHCWRLWHGCVITWNGHVVPCCFDKDATYQLGNLHQHPLVEIWNNHHYDHFRSRILQSRKKIDICRNCSEGLTVWT